jgi:hypothetical protein
MKFQEKKYRVDSFTKILKLLKEKGAKKGKEITSIHYYGQHKSNDVEKFVEYVDRCEIHMLKEQSGRFIITDHSVIPGKKTGFEWLKKRGFTKVNIVKMVYTEYEYKNGTIGLYTINDFLYSVILYYPIGQHEVTEKEFGLSSSEVISVPYNKFLEKMGRLQSKNLK